MNILEQIAAQTRERIEAEKRQTPTEELIRQIEATEQKKSKRSFYSIFLLVLLKIRYDQ